MKNPGRCTGGWAVVSPTIFSINSRPLVHRNRDWARARVVSGRSAGQLLRTGVTPRGLWEHRADNLEVGHVGSSIRVEIDERVTHVLLDSDLEHGTVSAVQFHGVLADLDDLV